MNPVVPASQALPSNYLQIGDYEFGDGTTARCVITSKPKSDSKVDKKEADGKSGAVTTWKGAKPSEVEIDLMWIRRDAQSHNTIVEILYQLSPNGPMPGNPWQYTSAYARIHGQDTVIVENVDGPNDKPGSDEVTCKLKCTSWKKPAATAQGQGQSTTATAATAAAPYPTTPLTGPGGLLPPHNYDAGGATGSWAPNSAGTENYSGGSTPTTVP